MTHPTRSLLVSSSTVGHGTSSIPVAGLGAGLVVVGVLGLSQRSGSFDTAVSAALAALVMLGVSVQVVVRDRALRRANAQLALRADYDDLTGLLNRNGIRRRLDLVLGAVRRGERSAAVVFVDLDRFSVVNDSLGHDVGDEVLVAVASRLARVVGPDHLVGRLGGDEFLVLLNWVDEQGAMEVAERLLDACATPVASTAGPVQISASAGVLSIGRGETVELADAIRSADLAMYRSKHQGRGRATVFDTELSSQIARRHGIDQALRAQVDDGFRLELHHQPIVRPATGELCGFEALSRWNDPLLGRVGPDEFIPVAEDSGVIGPLGRWALVEALTQLRRWREESGRNDLWVSVNLSGRQLTEPDLVAFVSDSLSEAGLPAESLTLELTESSLIEHGTADSEVLHELRALGVGLAVDDFGTGYSSLSYLAKMPVTAVKIDRSFVEGLSTAGARGRPVVDAVVQLARSFDLKVVAEGVEETDVAIRLAEVGVDHAQGWLWSPALPADEALALVRSHGRSPASGLGASSLRQPNASKSSVRA